MRYGDPQIQAFKDPKHNCSVMISCQADMQSAPTGLTCYLASPKLPDFLPSLPDCVASARHFSLITSF